MRRVFCAILATCLCWFTFHVAVYASTPLISGVSDNRSAYTNNAIPAYEKFEITFSVTSTATNLYLPFDSTPPAGIQSGTGIAVEGLFSDNNWQTTYTQPAFYYQDFDIQTKGTKDWIYPKDTFVWKVRFAPHKPGVWQYKLKAQDIGGSYETQPQSFTVVSSGNNGFINVSRNDARYFEFDDGTLFPGLGYNMNYDQVGWNNPIQQNQTNFQKMGQNGIQFIRIWLSQWTIHGNAWSIWRAFPGGNNGYVPVDGVDFVEAYPGKELSLAVGKYGPCNAIEGLKARPAVKYGSSYRVRARVKPTLITGPTVQGNPYGFVIKTGNWLWDANDVTKRCSYPGTGSVISATYSGSGWTQSSDPVGSGWVILEGTLNTANSSVMYGQRDFLPNIYVALENTTGGVVYVDEVWVQEDLGGGNFGPNIISRPDMDSHTSMDQRQSFAFDKVLELARQHNVYIRPVLLEKNEWIWRHINFDGEWISGEDPACWDTNTANDPIYQTGLSAGYKKCPITDPWFYGNMRNPSKARWLQYAFLRYVQARWGYSTNIHSWELLNEGDPYVQNTGGRGHYALADEFGKFMKCTVFGVAPGIGDGQLCSFDHPNHHMVSTSFWSGFPQTDFWANSKYPNIDFTDLHLYIPKSSDPTHFYDTAAASYDYSKQYSAFTRGTGKPTVWGETGFTNTGSGPESGDLLADTQGVWLHNFLWGQIGPGGMYQPSYWYPNKHIYYTYTPAVGSPVSVDNRVVFKPYYDFIKDIPLNNGHYQDVQASVSDQNVRVWGQKDATNKRAHVWIAHVNHTWKNVIDNASITPASATITLEGFVPSTAYPFEWWDTYTGQITSTESKNSNELGQLVFTVTSLTTDMAVKIGDYASDPAFIPGDINKDRAVNILDYALFSAAFANTHISADVNGDGAVNILDYATLSNNFGKTN